jgi:putative tryptophan/tyrosine transport system substrate-binding protein
MRLIGLAVVLTLNFTFALLAAEAQQPRRAPTIAVIYGNTPEEEIAAPHRTDRQAQAFVQAMSRLGWVEGQNITIIWRSAEGRPDRYQVLAQDLASNKLHLMVVAGGPPLLRVLQKAMNTIPIVMAGTFADPVGSGVAKSLARPEGNVTGLTTSPSRALNDKRLELLRETAPRISRVAYLTNTGLRVPESAARSLGVTLLPVAVDAPDRLQPALVDIARQHVDAVFVADGQFFWAQRYAIVEFAAKQRLPTIYPYDIYTRAGGLMSYGANYVDIFQQAARYVDKILKGPKPGDLPIEQPTKLELVINLKTAKALGLTIPPSVLLRADQVIE